MDDSSDPLGSFFAEIDELDSSDTYKNALATGGIAAVADGQQPAAIQVVVAAKPAIIGAATSSMSAPSHPVYTYDAPEGYIPYEKQRQPPPPTESRPQHSSNFSFHSASSSSSFSSASAPVASISSFVAHPVGPSQAQTSGISFVPLSETAAKKVVVRSGGGDTWVDDTLGEWPENDFRIFVGDIGKEVSTEMLAKAFSHYKSFAMAKVVRSKVENKGRGFGFVSFLDPMECAKAIREMNGKYLGLRPMKITKSTWKERDMKEVKKKENKKRKLHASLGLDT